MRARKDIQSNKKVKIGSCLRSFPTRVSHLVSILPYLSFETSTLPLSCCSFPGAGPSISRTHSSLKSDSVGLDSKCRHMHEYLSLPSTPTPTSTSAGSLAQAQSPGPAPGPSMHMGSMRGMGAMEAHHHMGAPAPEPESLLAAVPPLPEVLGGDRLRAGSPAPMSMGPAMGMAPGPMGGR